jgi:peptide/nickel transport system permease protein
MIQYLIRRILYAIPTLVGVLVLTFVIFFGIYSPEQLARQNIATKNPSEKQIKTWLKDRGYDKPRTELFKEQFTHLAVLDFGKSDRSKEPIWDRIRSGAGPSFQIAAMVMLSSLVASLTLATMLAYFRGTYVDRLGTVMTVLLLSIPYVVYVLGMQFLLGKLLKYGPIAGFESGAGSWRFVFIPMLVGVISGIGGSVRLYRTFLLEEMSQDYVRTARAKGVKESAVLYKHVLKNAFIPVITTTVASIPALILGSLILESTFNIPGIGNYLVDAVNKQDFAVVRAMVYLGTILTIAGLILTDVLYSIVDPRVRLE